MKINKVLFFYFLLYFAGATKINAQPYIPMPDSNACWRLSDATILESFRVDSVKNDTNINTIDYIKLFYGSYYIGGYRNDMAGKKTFFIPNDSTQEYLLYDFSLNMSDTVLVITRVYSWPPYPISYNIIKLIVDSIVNKAIGPRNHKRIYLSNTNSNDYAIWTDGIGNCYSGIIGSRPWNATKLYCMSFNDTVYYKYNFNLAQESNYFMGQCDTINEPLSINENLISSSINFFPSIVHTTITITSLDKNIFPLQISIYNSLGVFCKSFFVEDDRLLNISDLSQGVYFLQIKAENKTYKTHKIIKE